MKVSTSTVLGVLVGVAVGLISLGRVNALSPEIGSRLHDYAWWIVVLSMVPPLADYLTGVRTTVLGVVTGHPYRHWAGFFAGLAVGLGFLLLLSSKVPILTL